MEYRSPIDSRLYQRREDAYPQRDNRYSPYSRPSHAHGSAKSSYDMSQGSGSSRSGSNSSTFVARYSDRFKQPQYPNELTKQLGASRCELCQVDFSSPIMGKLHYGGKPHAKKVKLFLTEWSERTGGPMPNMEEAASVKVTPCTAQSPLSDYCELCDVRLISANDKLLHYSGKNHMKNLRDPNNARKKKSKIETIVMDRFGIGSDFRPDVKSEPIGLGVECKLCNVKTISEEQMAVHLSGKKHKEKLAKVEANDIKSIEQKKAERPYHCEICDVFLESKYLYQLHLDGKRHQKKIQKKDLAGVADYCELCDVSFNGMECYQSHVEGKKHLKKLAEKQQEKYKTEVLSVACPYCPFVGLNVKFHNCDKSLTKINLNNIDKQFSCPPCVMFFDTEEEFNKHKETDRHIVCVFNRESGDKIVEELEHFYCYVCKEQYGDNKTYTEHLFNTKHNALSNKTTLETNKDVYSCHVCGIFILEKDNDEHMMHPTHLLKAVEKETREHLTELATEDSHVMEYNCEVCNQLFTNLITYSNHVLSKQHQDKAMDERIKQIKRMKKFAIKN